MSTITRGHVECLVEDLSRLQARDRDCGAATVPGMAVLTDMCTGRVNGMAEVDLRRRRAGLANRLEGRPTHHDETIERDRAVAEHLAASMDFLSARSRGLAESLERSRDDAETAELIRCEIHRLDQVRGELAILIDERLVRLEHHAAAREREDAWLLAHCLDILEIAAVDAALDISSRIDADHSGHVNAAEKARARKVIEAAAYHLDHDNPGPRLPADVLVEDESLPELAELLSQGDEGAAA